MPQQLVLEPLGIVTEPNKLGQVPAGALSAATNAAERSPGVIENLPAWAYHFTITTSSTQAAFVIPLPGKYSLVFALNGYWTVAWVRNVDGIQDYAEAFGSWLAGATDAQTIDLTAQPRFSYALMNGRLFVKASEMLLVFDNLEPTSSVEARPHQAGLRAPRITNVSRTSTGVVYATSQHAHYVAVLKRKIGSHLIVSEPSVAVSALSGTAGPIDVTIEVALYSGDAIAGDTVELYRTEVKPTGQTAAFQAFAAGEEAGAEYKRVASKVLTAADLPNATANNFVQLTDSTRDSERGTPLYTNQSVQGFGARAEVPPALDLIAAHKGYVFGFGPTYSARVEMRPTGPWGGFDTAETADQVQSGLGRMYSASALSWTAGSPTVSGLTAGETAKLAVGMWVRTTGNFGVVNSLYIAAIGSTTITLSENAASSGSDVVYFYDWLGYAVGGGIETGSFATSWTQLALGVGYGYSDVEIYSQSLKLAPYTFPYTDSESGTQPTDGFELRARRLDAARSPLIIRGSKVGHWDPSPGPWDSSGVSYYPEYTPQKIVWSNLNEPDAWPPANFDYFSRGSVCAVASTRDAIIASYTDAFWRISGTGGTPDRGFDWRYDPIATGITVRGSQCMATLLDKVYALTSDGLVVISDSSFQNITKGRVHDQLSTPPWSDEAYSTAAAFVAADEENNEILFRDPSAPNGEMWVYNVDTDRLTKTISHPNPTHAAYSTYHRAMMVVGQESNGAWTVRIQNGSYSNMSLSFATVYADNPFAQRHWQTVDVSAETTGATVAVTCNGVYAGSRTLDANGRAGFEVPRNAPAIGNTLQVTVDVTTSVRTKLHGFAVRYRDQTDRRANR